MSSITLSIENPSDVTFSVIDGNVSFNVVKKPRTETPEISEIPTETPKTCTETPETLANMKLANLMTQIMKSDKFESLMKAIIQIPELKEMAKEPKIMEALNDVLGDNRETIVQHFLDLTKILETKEPVKPVETVVACEVKQSPVIEIGSNNTQFKYTRIGNMVMPGMYFASVRECKALNDAEFAELQKMFEVNAKHIVLEANGTTRMLNPPISVTPIVVTPATPATYSVPTITIGSNVVYEGKPGTINAISLGPSLTIAGTTNTLEHPSRTVYHPCPPVSVPTMKRSTGDIRYVGPPSGEKFNAESHYREMLDEYMYNELCN